MTRITATTTHDRDCHQVDEIASARIARRQESFEPPHRLPGVAHTEKYQVSLPDASELYGQLAQILVESGCVVENRAADPEQGTVSVRVDDDSHGIAVSGTSEAVEAGVGKFQHRFGVAATTRSA